MNMDDLKIRDFLKGASAVPPCPTDKFVNSFLAQMDDKLEIPVINKTNNWGRIAAVFAFVTFGIGAIYINQSQKSENVEALVLASISNPDDLENEDLSETLIYGEKSEDAFAASLIGNDDISTIVSISDP